MPASHHSPNARTPSCPDEVRPDGGDDPPREAPRTSGSTVASPDRAPSAIAQVWAALGDFAVEHSGWDVWEHPPGWWTELE
jgi:hypothetical protein